jgi:hypothetical protein
MAVGFLAIPATDDRPETVAIFEVTDTELFALFVSSGYSE